MGLLRDASGRIRWISLLAALGLVAGLSAAWWYARPPHRAPLPSMPRAAMPDDVIHKALAQGGVVRALLDSVRAGRIRSARRIRRRPD
jgi:hypothetical protein